MLTFTVDMLLRSGFSYCFDPVVSQRHRRQAASRWRRRMARARSKAARFWRAMTSVGCSQPRAIQVAKALNVSDLTRFTIMQKPYPEAHQAKEWATQSLAKRFIPGGVLGLPHNKEGLYDPREYVEKSREEICISWVKTQGWRGILGFGKWETTHKTIRYLVPTGGVVAAEQSGDRLFHEAMRSCWCRRCIPKLDYGCDTCSRIRSKQSAYWTHRDEDYPILNRVATAHIIGCDSETSQWYRGKKYFWEGYNGFRREDRWSVKGYEAAHALPRMPDF